MVLTHENKCWLINRLQEQSFNLLWSNKEENYHYFLQSTILQPSKNSHLTVAQPNSQKHSNYDHSQNTFLVMKTASLCAL